MSVCFVLLFALLCFVVPASAQTEVPTEIIDVVREAGGPHAVEALRELLLVIGTPGAWLLHNPWALAILLSLLVWAVAGRIAWAVVKTFAVLPLKTWVAEGTGKPLIEKAHGTFERLAQWYHDSLEGPAVELMKKRAWVTLGGLGAASAVFHEQAKPPDGDFVGTIVVTIAGLGALAWVLWGVGNDAYKTIVSISQPDVRVQYPYSFYATFLGVVSGAVGLAGMVIGEAIGDSGGALVKNMEVLVGGAVSAVGG